MHRDVWMLRVLPETVLPGIQKRTEDMDAMRGLIEKKLSRATEEQLRYILLMLDNMME